MLYAHLSWKNPVERITSIINLALQSVGMMRSATKIFEDQLRSCKSLSDIRALADKFPSLKDGSARLCWTSQNTSQEAKPEGSAIYYILTCFAK